MEAGQRYRGEDGTNVISVDEDKSSNSELSDSVGGIQNVQLIFITFVSSFKNFSKQNSRF